jgi:hypothetical protein
MISFNAIGGARNGMAVGQVCELVMSRTSPIFVTTQAQISISREKR